MTTPEFSTWSRISRRETSSSPPRISTDSKSVGIRDKRIRRPRPIYFDAPPPLPPLYKILQDPVPLPAFVARNQKRGLPQQISLRAAHLAAGRGVRRDLAHPVGKVLQLLVVAFRTRFQPRRLLLQILLARPRRRRGDRRRLSLSNYLHAPFVATGNAGKDLVERGLSAQHVLYKSRLTGKDSAKAGGHDRDLSGHFTHDLLMAHAMQRKPLQIFHVALNGFSKAGLIDLADPAEEIAACQGLDSMNAINPGAADLRSFWRRFGGRFLCGRCSRVLRYPLEIKRACYFSVWICHNSPVNFFSFAAPAISVGKSRTRYRRCPPYFCYNVCKVANCHCCARR